MSHVDLKKVAVMTARSIIVCSNPGLGAETSDSQVVDFHTRFRFSHLVVVLSKISNVVLRFPYLCAFLFWLLCIGLVHVYCWVQSMRVVLALKGLDIGGHVVVELMDIDNMMTVELIGRPIVETVVSHSIIGRMLLLATRNPGVANIYDEVCIWRVFPHMNMIILLIG